MRPPLSPAAYRGAFIFRLVATTRQLGDVRGDAACLLANSKGRLSGRPHYLFLLAVCMF
jgi:hypothetical protein